MSLYDALHPYYSLIFLILSRHEQGAIHATQGYTRVSRKIGVCIGSSGPGATNFITGLADSFIDSLPVLCICGQVSSNLLGKNSFQETNIIDISIDITKWNEQVLITEDIGISLQKAFYIANHERKSPVLIDISKDAQIKKSSFENALYKVEYYKLDRYCPYAYANTNTNSPVSSIENCYELINSSKKTLVLVGQGIGLEKSEVELKSLIERADIPLSASLLGIDVIDSANTLFMGMLGMHGNYPNNLLTNQSDVLIALAMRFDDRITGDIKRYARKAKLIHIDRDKCEIGKQINCHISLYVNCKQILPIITEKLRKTTKKVWVDIFYYLKKCEEKRIKRDIYTANDAISMGEVINQLNTNKDKDAILITDVGQHQMLSCRYFLFTERKSKVTSAGIGTMGFSLPVSLGMQFGNKERQIICLVGDGGFNMTIQEFGAILHNKLTIKVILLNNCFLGLVKQWQDFFFSRRYAFTKIINPDFNKVAKAYEIESKKVLNRNLLVKEVKEVLEYSKASFLEVGIKSENEVLPMTSNGGSGDEGRLISNLSVTQSLCKYV